MKKCSPELRAGRHQPERGLVQILSGLLRVLLPVSQRLRTGVDAGKIAIFVRGRWRGAVASGLGFDTTGPFQLLPLLSRSFPEAFHLCR